MPRFLEDKLRAEYGNNKHAIYGTMNAIGAMHGNKITAKGRAMEAKHNRDVSGGRAPAKSSGKTSYPKHSSATGDSGTTGRIPVHVNPDRTDAMRARSSDGHNLQKHAAMTREAHQHLSTSMPEWGQMSQRMKGVAMQEHVRARRGR